MVTVMLWWPGYNVLPPGLKVGQWSAYERGQCMYVSNGNKCDQSVYCWNHVAMLE